MRCDDVRPLLSAALDEPLSAGEADALAEHIDGCDACLAFHRHLAALRRELRYELAEAAPDVAPAVLAAIASHQPRRPVRSGRWASVAAVFVVAFLVGGSLAGLNPRNPPVVDAAPIPEQVLDAQASVQSMTAVLTVVERGWHPEVGERRFDGTLSYRAPEQLAIELRDRTDYPSGDWHPNDMTLMAVNEQRWTRGLVACPREALPGCQSPEPRVLALDGREPFDDASPVPLDLVVPVRSFALAAQPELLGEARIAGRGAVGVAVTAAQLAPLLDGLRAAGHWRELHPADRAELWLDQEVLAPLAVRVLPAQTAERDLWAARHGYDDAPGIAVLEMELGEVTFTGPASPEAFSSPPTGARLTEAGFVESSVPAAVPEALPAGMSPHRHGVLRTAKGPEVAVATWSDGRAWLKVRSTREWRGGRLFGDLGEVVRRADLGPQGTAYVDESGDKVAVHTAEMDVVVTGSLPVADLARVAGSLGLTGLPVPATWEEASSVSIDAVDPSVLLPAGLGGFGEPTVRADRDVLTIAWAGPGARGFVLTQGPGNRLSPPFTPDVVGVQLRGVTARYTPSSGDLEWGEDGTVVSLRSRTLALDELVRIAESLEGR